MKSNNETVSRQNLWAGNIAKSMTSEGNSALSCWQPLQRVWKKFAGNFNSKLLATEQIDQNFKIILGIKGSLKGNSKREERRP